MTVRENTCLPSGSKISEDRVIRGFMANIRAGVEAGDPGSIALAIRLRARKQP